MRIYLETMGCRVNYAEMTDLGGQLAARGYELVGSAADADLCVLNSCTVTAEAARQSRQLARQLARANPSTRLVVTGCYATLEGEAVAQLPNVSLVVGNSRKDELLALIQGLDQKAAGWGQAASPGLAHGQSAVKECENGVGNPIPSSQSGACHRTRAFVKVQDGCRNRCTFCIVAVARGDERSRPVAEVVAEVDALHRQGYQEAVLTGVHLGAYGRDASGSLRGLVCELLARTAIPRLRLSSLEPFDLEAGVFDLWCESDGRLMPHLHLPAQSGSDAVLKRMARRNRTVDFEVLVEVARARIPGLTITTDLIAGFPGETVEDFAQTVAFARRMCFAHLHVFPYSPRAGTAAARFDGQVPHAERKRRGRVLNDLDIELGRAVRQSFLGQTRAVLWEHRVGRDGQAPMGGVLSESDGMIWSGITDNYLHVLTAAPAGVQLHNCIILTRLVRLESDELWGEVVTG